MIVTYRVCDNEKCENKEEGQEPFVPKGWGAMAVNSDRLRNYDLCESCVAKALGR